MKSKDAKGAMALSAMERPRFIEISPDLHCASFGLMKLLPARFIIDRAEEREQVRPGGVICESTSGSFGLALAMLGSQRGYQVKLVSDPAMDRHLLGRIQALGASVVIVDKPLGQANYQSARLQKLQELLNAEPNSYWPQQYTNPDNPLSYASFASEALDTIGPVDFLVGSVGSGGSMSGTAKFMRLANPNLTVVAVDTHHSVLFGHEDRPRLVRGLGNSILPSNLDHTQFNYVHWVPPYTCFEATRLLMRREGLFKGPTSGATYHVAKWIARENPGTRVLAILPDDGDRYVETVYCDAWLGQKLAHTRFEEMPLMITSPRENLEAWTCFHWRRRAVEFPQAA